MYLGGLRGIFCVSRWNWDDFGGFRRIWVDLVGCRGIYLDVGGFGCI